MENENIKKGKKYLLIGVLILFLAILGSSVAYYLARVQGSLSGKAAGTGLDLTITPLSTSANDNGDLIPLDNDKDTLNQAILGYGNTSNNFDSAKACIDINNYSVCQVYKVTLTNNGTVPVVVNSNVTLSGANTPNIDCTTMDDEKSVSNSNSCIGDNTLANNDTINGNKSKDYYIVVYIKNLDVPQTDSGEFNGTITFTSTQGDQVKGRFKQGDTLVEHITKLYNDNKNTRVTNNNIEYQYATSVNLMNDRLGGTTTDINGGNIRYYGATPNNYIDIGDKYETDATQGNWETMMPGSTKTQCEEAIASMSDEDVYGITGIHKSEFCNTTTIEAGTPILWRIIGVFDGKLRIRRDENIGGYSFDTAVENSGDGINEWSQSDLMKLLNSGYEEEIDGGSLWYDSQSGKCFAGNRNVVACDFTNTGLSSSVKNKIVDQILYLGGFNTTELFSNEAYQVERTPNVIQNPSDGITRTTQWSGKVGLIYPSDNGYAADFRDDNCNGNFSTYENCTENWMNQGYTWTISPWLLVGSNSIQVAYGGFYNKEAYNGVGGWPTLTLDPSLLFDNTTDGSIEHPYKIVD